MSPLSISPAQNESTASLNLIEHQLEGRWRSDDAENVYSIWTFHNGSFVVDTFVNGEKIENSTIGTYAIGTDAIHTVIIDQENKVEGSIPFTIAEHTLVLCGANGTLSKEEE